MLDTSEEQLKLRMMIRARMAEAKKCPVRFIEFVAAPPRDAAGNVIGPAPELDCRTATFEFSDLKLNFTRSESESLEQFKERIMESIPTFDAPLFVILWPVDDDIPEDDA